MSSGPMPEIKNTGPLKPGLVCDRFLFFSFLIGLVVFVLALLLNPERAWYNYLIEFFYFLTIGLGAVVFAAVQYVANGTWSVSIRRIAEGFAAYLPVSLILLVGLFFGIGSLYEWSEFVPEHYFTYTKHVYLTSLWFIVRELIFFGVWIVLALLIVKFSLKQDETENPSLTRKNKKLSILFLIVFGFTFTFASIDLLMSLEEHFYSTMFGVYCFSGLFLSGISATAIVVILLRGRGYLENGVEHIHLHDLGTWMMAFSVFMVYIGFSQYMLIWYADLPHEITYFIPRSKNGWQFVLLMLPLLKWILPFIVLMPDKNRANPAVIFAVAVGVLVGQWLDVYWMVVPTFSESFRMVSWIEVGVFLMFLGIFGLSVRYFYKKYPLLAKGDPNLESCVTGRYQHV